MTITNASNSSVNIKWNVASRCAPNYLQFQVIPHKENFSGNNSQIRGMFQTYNNFNKIFFPQSIIIEDLHLTRFVVNSLWGNFVVERLEPAVRYKIRVRILLAIKTQSLFVIFSKSNWTNFVTQESGMYRVKPRMEGVQIFIKSHINEKIKKSTLKQYPSM